MKNKNILNKSEYIKLIFLYTYGNNQAIRAKDEYARYWLYEFGISNPRALHLSLIKDGYLQKSSPKDIISRSRAYELKEMCESLGLAKTGKKELLIQRIFENASNEQLFLLCDNLDVYSRSQMGEEFVNIHSDYMELYRNKDWGISLDEYNSYKSELPFSPSFKDVAWGIMNQRSLLYTLSHDQRARNNYFHMFQLLDTEQRHSQAMEYLLYVLFFDINCSLSARLKYETAHQPLDSLELAPGIIEKIIKYEKYYSECLVDVIYSQYVDFPIIICPDNIFKEMLYELYTLPTLDEDKYLDIFRNNFNNLTELVVKNNNLSKPHGCSTNTIALLVIIVVTFLFS